MARRDDPAASLDLSLPSENTMLCRFSRLIGSCLRMTYFLWPDLPIPARSLGEFVRWCCRHGPRLRACVYPCHAYKRPQVISNRPLDFETTLLEPPDPLTFSFSDEVIQFEAFVAAEHFNLIDNYFGILQLGCCTFRALFTSFPA